MQQVCLPRAKEQESLSFSQEEPEHNSMALELQSAICLFLISSAVEITPHQGQSGRQAPSRTGTPSLRR